MEANNSYCGVGIAFNARIGGPNEKFNFPLFVECFLFFSLILLSNNILIGCKGFLQMTFEEKCKNTKRVTWKQV